MPRTPPRSAAARNSSRRSSPRRRTPPSRSSNNAETKKKEEEQEETNIIKEQAHDKNRDSDSSSVGVKNQTAARKTKTSNNKSVNRRKKAPVNTTLRGRSSSGGTRQQTPRVKREEEDEDVEHPTTKKRKRTTGSSSSTTVKKSSQSSDDDNDEKSATDEEDVPSSAPLPIKKRRSGRAQSVNYKEPADEESEFSVSSEKSSSEEKEERDSRKRKSRNSSSTATTKKKIKNEDGKSKKSPPRKEKKGQADLSAEDLTCPHCSKVFTVLAGLQYHVNHYVCRQKERPGGPVQKGRRKVELSPGGTSSTRKTKYRKERGPLEDRKCPNCKRVFTSVLGCNYHLEKRVCYDDGTKGKLNLQPGATLRAGQEFVTPFGVVRVVRDNRAVPDSQPDEEPLTKDKVKTMMKNWKKSNGLRESQANKLQYHNTSQHLYLRKRLRELYEKGGINQQSVFDTCFGKDPRKILPSDYGATHSTPSLLPDPSIPQSCKPDRVVECILITDKRDHSYVGRRGSEEEDDDTDTAERDDEEDSATTKSTTRLYLPRRLLQDAYMDNVSIYHCSDCGRAFTTKPGIKYHLDSKSCISTAPKLEAAKQYMERIDQRAEKVLLQGKKKPEAKTVASGSIIKKPVKKRDKSVKALSVYPQVWLSLDFKLLPWSEKATKEGVVSAFHRKERRRRDDAAGGDAVMTAVGGEATAETVPAEVTSSAHQRHEKVKEEENPDDVLRELELELRLEQSKILGPMYPEVFHSLQYNQFTLPPKPKKKKKKKKKRKIRKARRNPERKTEPKIIPAVVDKPKEQLKDPPQQQQLQKNAPPAAAPLPPIIDTSVLAAEIDAGRFTSMSRYKGENHQSFCAICKKEECEIESGGSGISGTISTPLVGCDFCEKAVHFPCMLTQFTVKMPEPKDDFLCYHCIASMITKRTRAEKRRRDREAARQQQDKKKKGDDVSMTNHLELLNGVVPNKEYACVAAQGRRVNDLVELLRDARVRLRNCVHASELNRIRLAMIDDDNNYYGPHHHPTTTGVADGGGAGGDTEQQPLLQADDNEEQEFRMI